MISAAAVTLMVCGFGVGCAAVYPYLFYLRKIQKISFTNSPKLPEYPAVSVVINAYQEGELVRTRIEDIFHAIGRQQMLIDCDADGIKGEPCI